MRKICFFSKGTDGVAIIAVQYFQIKNKKRGIKMLINFPEPLTKGNVKAIEFFKRLKELENELYDEYFDNAMKLQDKWDKTNNNEYKKRYEKQGERLNKNFLNKLEIEIKKLEKDYNAKRISFCIDPNTEKRTMIYALPAIN